MGRDGKSTFGVNNPRDRFRRGSRIEDEGWWDHKKVHGDVPCWYGGQCSWTLVFETKRLEEETEENTGVD